MHKPLRRPLLTLTMIRPGITSLLLALSLLPSIGVAATYDRTLTATSVNLRGGTVPAALFGANIGYWSVISHPDLVTAAQEAGLTSLRYHPGTYNDPDTVPGSINMWDFTAVDAFGAARLGDYGRFLIATGATGQISFNYGAGSPAQAAALVAYLRVRTDAPAELLNLSLGSAVVEPTLTGTRTRDWRTVGFWAGLRASAPLAVDDGFNKLRLNHPAPFPIQHWECGNEADYKFVPCLRYRIAGQSSITQGATGYGGRRADARTYAEFYAAAKALMQRVDPTIEVGASAGYFEQAYDDTAGPAVPYLFPGTSGTTKAWTPVMLTRLKELGVVPDFIIAHRYTQQTDFAWNNGYLLRGALRAYLATPAQGDLPRIHVTELNWAENEYEPYTTTINNAVNLARSFGDALQNDVANLAWFTFTSGSANYNAASTTGWRRYHNWGLLADDPATAQNPNPASLAWPGHFARVRFPVFHAFALLKDFVRPGDRIYTPAALAPADTNSTAVPVFAARRSNGDLTLLVLNRETTAHTLRLTLASAGTLQPLVQGRRYGQAQDEEQRLKAIATPPVTTNNNREAFTLTLDGTLLTYAAPPLSVTTLTLAATPPTPPVFTQAASATALAGRPFTFDLAATPTPTAYAATGLPAGLTLDPATGRISGTPATPGEYTVTLAATHPGGSVPGQLVLLVTATAPVTLAAETFDAANTADWWAYSGDGGVTRALTNQANGPASSPALNLAVTVAPPATYWYAGLGRGFTGTPPFTAATLAQTVLELDLWVSPTPSAQVTLVFKTPGNNGTLSHTVTVPGQTWTPVSIPLSVFTAANFDYAAPDWQFLVVKDGAGWPLATSSIRIDDFLLTRLTPAYTPLQLWRNQNFSTPAPIGPAANAADPDADGVNNLLEYALASDPLTPTNTGITLGVLNPSTSSLTLSFFRARADLTYVVEASADLSAWSPLATNPGTVGQSVTVTDSQVPAPARFLRLRVTAP